MATGRTISRPFRHATTTPEALADPFEPLLQRITLPPAPNDEEDQREAAELLHALGTSEAMRRLGTRPRHAFARALLRDTRWDAAEAGPVPILGEPAPFATASELVALRLRRAAASAAARWAGASAGGGPGGSARWRRRRRCFSPPHHRAPRRSTLRRCWRLSADAVALLEERVSVRDCPSQNRLRDRVVFSHSSCGAALGGGVAGFTRAVTGSMEPRNAGRGERRHSRRARRTRDRRSCGAGLQPEHATVPKAGSLHLAAASDCRPSV